MLALRLLQETIGDTSSSLETVDVISACTDKYIYCHSTVVFLYILSYSYVQYSV